MTPMRTIARAGDIHVFQELNGTIVVERGRGVYLCDTKSAYEAIREIASDQPEVRAELLKQWAQDIEAQTNAEHKPQHAPWHVDHVEELAGTPEVE